MSSSRVVVVCALFSPILFLDVYFFKFFPTDDIAAAEVSETMFAHEANVMLGCVNS